MDRADKKQISRDMIAGTLSSRHEGDICDVDPAKPRQERSQCEAPAENADNGRRRDGKSPGRSHRTSSSQEAESSAIISLSSVNLRYPSFSQTSTDPRHLSTIPEMPVSHQWAYPLNNSHMAGLNMYEQRVGARGAFELRSPTSIYSQDSPDPFTSQRSPQTPTEATGQHPNQSFEIRNPAPPNSPFWTVLNDPRAKELPFMQNTGNGWTAELDQFVYSKHEAGPEASADAARTTIPEYGTILDYARLARAQKRPGVGHTSIENELAAVGYDQVHAAIEKQQQDNRFEYSKSLPSPPVENFSPEIRARLGLAQSHSSRGIHQRSDTAPSLHGYHDRQASDHRNHHYSPSQHQGRMSASPQVVDPSIFGTAAHEPLQSGEQSPSRLARWRTRLGRSPERRGVSEGRSWSPERMYLRPSVSSHSSSPERRGRAASRDSPERQSTRGSDGSDLGRPTLAGSDGRRANFNESFVHHTPERSTTLPVFASDSIPRASMDKLWGNKGVLSRPNHSPGQSNTPKGKKTPLKDMASKLFKQKDSAPTGAANSTGSPEAKPAAADGQSKFPISIERGDQMRLFGEIEYILQTLANDFLLEQLAAGRLSKKSVREAVDRWSRRGRAQVVDFCFDLRSQLELLQQNLDGVQFHGRDAFDGKRKFVLVYAWKDVARELAVRSFCSADSAVRKMLSDCYVILDMLGAEGAYWLIFQKLHVTTLDKIRDAAEERQRKLEARPGQTRQVVPGSPLKNDDGQDELRTNRHFFESV